MLVSISLEHPHTNYTNLDVVNGKVFLRVPNPGTISSIVVKLEGESRTRLLAAVRPDRPERQRPVLEVHKILYKAHVVFPPNLTHEEVLVGAKNSIMMEPGQYEYPFSFKIPINNACRAVNDLATTIKMGGPPTNHVKQTLPPSLNGFPGEAEIRYYVKVTVNRPQFFKENPRAIANLTLLPIEPPRPPKSDEESYARRPHQFLDNNHGPEAPGGKKKSSFFSFDRKGSSSNISLPPTPTSPITPVSGGSSVLPRFTVDARLPHPAILTCGKDLPLRIIVKNMSERSKNVYLQMLQIELIGYTRVRSHDFTRTESSSWIIASFSNMAIPLGSPSDPVGTETPINPEYWSDKALPNTVAPTFTTCNITRYYELEVRVGLGYGSYKHGEDQLVVLPLRMGVKVYSGITPPRELLEATLAAEGSGKVGQAGPPYNDQAAQQSHGPYTPVDGPAGFAGANAFPPAQSTSAQGASAGASLAAPQQPPYDDAPPSYEDAVGQNLPPIHGQRASYAPPPVPEGAPRFSDEKRR